MLRDVAFGQYYPTESFVHRMDPRAKILLIILYITAIFCAVTYFSFALVALVLIVTIAVSGVPFRSVLKSVKPILFIIIFTAVLNLLFPRDGNVLVEFWIIRITDAAVSFTVMMVLRLVLLVMGTSLLTFTTTPVALTDGIEALLKPLKIVRFPVHELALIMSIALRFIPTLMDETDRIIRAQKARGADFPADLGVPAGGRAVRRHGVALLCGRQGPHQVQETALRLARPDRRARLCRPDGCRHRG